MNTINTSPVSVAKAVWAKANASADCKDRVAIATMKQDDQWFLYTLLNTENFDSFAEGENLYRITAEEVVEIQKEISTGYCAAPEKPLEFMFSRSTKDDVTSIVSASSDNVAMFNTLVKGNIRDSVVRIYGKAASDELVKHYHLAGFQIQQYTNEEQVKENVAKLLNTYREKVNGCSLAN